jgi:hypothetical protein
MLSGQKIRNDIILIYGVHFNNLSQQVKSARDEVAVVVLFGRAAKSGLGKPGGGVPCPHYDTPK